MLDHIYRKLVRPILIARDSPQAIAGGIAIGIGVGLSPTVGVQMPIAWLLATMCGANRLVAMALVWISNPITVLPIYYSEYLLGAWILERQTISSYSAFTALWESMAELDYLDRIAQVSDRIALPLVVGAMVPSVLLGVAAYPISLWRIRVRDRKRQASRLQSAMQPGAFKGKADGAAEKTVPPAMVGLLLVAMLFPPGCSKSGARVSRPGVPLEATTQGNLTVWSQSSDDQTLILIAPLYSAEKRNNFAAKRVEQLLQLDLKKSQCVALAIYRFGENEEPIRLGADGVLLRFSGESGIGTSLRPSEFQVGPEEQLHPVLASLFGAGQLPDLDAQQAIRLWQVLPTAEPLENLRTLEIQIGDQWISLDKHEMTAESFSQFSAEPSLESFQTAVLELASELLVPLTADS